MSVQAIAWVLEHSKSKGTARCVLLSIANHVGANGEGWCYVATIRREANCSLNSYRKALQWATEAGELERGIRAGHNTHRRGDEQPNLYRFPLLDRPPKTDPLETTTPQEHDPRGSGGSLPHRPPKKRGVATPQVLGGQSRPSEPSVKPEPLVAPAARKRDHLFEAVAKVCHFHLPSLTKTARGQLNAAVKQLRDVGATPEEVERRAEHYMAKYEGRVDLSPTALAKHWPALAEPPQPRRQRNPNAEALAAGFSDLAGAPNGTRRSSRADRGHVIDVAEPALDP